MRTLLVSFAIALALMCAFAAAVGAQPRLNGANKSVLTEQEFIQDVQTYIAARVGTMEGRRSMSGKTYRIVKDDDMVIALTHELVDIYMARGIQVR